MFALRQDVLLAICFLHLLLIQATPFQHQVCIYDKIRRHVDSGEYFIYRAVSSYRKDIMKIEFTKDLFEKGDFRKDGFTCGLQMNFVRVANRMWMICCK